MTYLQGTLSVEAFFAEFTAKRFLKKTKTMESFYSHNFHSQCLRRILEALSRMNESSSFLVKFLPTFN